MQQPQYQIKEWNDAHLEELSVSDRVQLIRMEDASASKLAKYEPVQDEVQPVINLEMKRYFATGGFTTVCVVVIAAAEQGAFAAAATVGGYIVAVGGGIGLAWVILKSCFTWTPDEPATGEPKKEEWEFYQEQRQGWRKKA